MPAGKAEKLHGLLGMSPVARVLVVDDDPPIRALVAKILERAGLAVETAADGEEAIERLRTADYDAVVVDLMMPRVDGEGVINFVKTLPGMHPAVIVASAGEPQVLHSLDSSVVHSIVRKPFEIDMLGDLVSAAARSIRQRKDEGRSDSNLLAFRPGVC
jgi:DNA-binding response OmpR family regulator